MTDEIDDREKPAPDWSRPPEPPVHRAARKGDIALLARLIEQGADIDQRADLEHDHGAFLKGLTTLMVAARSVDGATIGTLRWLVEHGAGIRAESQSGNTAAWYASGHGGRFWVPTNVASGDHLERLRYLLDLGLDPMESSSNGRSLVNEACRAGDPARVRLLLERGASADPRSVESARTYSSFQIPLFCAAQSGSAECVRVLLESGTSPNLRDSSGRTPLMTSGSPDVVRALVAGGADLLATDEYGKDALEAVLEESCTFGACGPERFMVARALMDAGADIERVDGYNNSRLWSTAFGHHADAVEFLLRAGANHDHRNAEGATPLHAICWQGEYQDDDTNRACERIIRTLVRAGVPIDALDDDGATAMHEAVYGDWGNPTAVRTLLQLGSSPDMPDGDGETPLMLAAQRGEVECIELLLCAGADVMHKDKAGHTAIDAAREHLRTWQGITADTVGDRLATMQDELPKQQEEEADADGTTPASPPDKLTERGGSPLAKAMRAFLLVEHAAGRKAP